MMMMMMMMMMVISAGAMQRAAADSVLHCDPRDEDRHSLVTVRWWLELSVTLGLGSDTGGGTLVRGGSCPVRPRSSRLTRVLSAATRPTGVARRRIILLNENVN